MSCVKFLQTALPNAIKSHIILIAQDLPLIVAIVIFKFSIMTKVSVMLDSDTKRNI